MKAYAVPFRPQAEDDLNRPHTYIVENSSLAVANRFVSRREQLCASLETFPQRGSLRRDLGAASEQSHCSAA